MDLFLNTALSSVDLVFKDPSGDVTAKTWAYSRVTSKQLLSYISEFLESKRASYHDLRQIYAVVGPGSFTGVRIGLSVVNAICFATDAVACAVHTSQYAEMRSDVTDFDWAVPCGARGLFFGSSKQKSSIYIAREDLQSHRKHAQILVFANRNDDPLLDMPDSMGLDDIRPLEAIFDHLPTSTSFSKLLEPEYGRGASISG